MHPGGHLRVGDVGRGQVPVREVRGRPGHPRVAELLHGAAGLLELERSGFVEGQSGALASRGQGAW